MSTDDLLATARPSTLTLMRRSKYVKRAILHGIYVLIGVSCWLLATVFSDEGPPESEPLVTFGFILFVGFFLFWFVWNARAGPREVAEWRRLMGVGIPAQGTVTLVEEHVVRQGFWRWRYGWEISYRYGDPRGRLHTGRSGYLSGRDARRWRIGATCHTLYDPAAPDKSVWVT